VDVMEETTVKRLRDTCLAAWNRIDILHYNVGIYLSGGDAPILDIEAGAFSHILDVNLRGMLLAAKHILPVMREQRAGVIINVGSIAAIMTFPAVAYKTSKAGVVTLTEHIAIANAAYGIRANVILPGLIETPMAVEPELGRGVSREEVIAQRRKRIPLAGRGGLPWDGLGRQELTRRDQNPGDKSDDHDQRPGQCREAAGFHPQQPGDVRPLRYGHEGEAGSRVAEEGHAQRAERNRDDDRADRRPRDGQEPTVKAGPMEIGDLKGNGWPWPHAQLMIATVSACRPIVCTVRLRCPARSCGRIITRYSTPPRAAAATMASSIASQ
jgi:hypothetical protein